MKMTRYYRSSLALLSLLLSSYSFSQTCIETNLAQNSGNRVSGHTNTGQSFTASCAGDILSVTVWYNELPTNGANTNDRVLHIRDGALCTSPILHTEYIPVGNIVVGANVFTLSTPVPINMGELNSWEITDVGQTADAAYGVSHNPSGLYPSGNAWFSCSQLTSYDLTFEVSIGSMFSVDLGADTTICPGESIVLDAGNGVSYLWNTGATTQTIVVSTAGTYGVTVEDAGANIANDSIVVNYFNNQAVDLGPDQDICLVDSICLSGAGTVGTSYLWNDSIPGLNFCATSPGTYWLSSTDSNSCTALDTIIITGIIMPVADIAICDTTNCPTVDFTNGSTNATYWSWTFGDGNSSGFENPSNTYMAGGSYTVTLLSENNCGADSTTKIVDIGCYAGLNENNDLDVSVYPNINSGTFQITLSGLNASELGIQLYTMGGELVFEKIAYPSSNIHVEEVNAGELSNGMYILKLSTIDNRLLKRIIISR